MLVAEHFLAGENEPWVRLLGKLEGGQDDAAARKAQLLDEVA